MSNYSFPDKVILTVKGIDSVIGNRSYGQN